MKLLLIHPPSREVYDKFERKAIDRMPIGLAYVAAIGEQEKHQVEVLDAEAMRLSLTEIGSAIDSFRPEVIGVTCTTPLFPISAKIVEMSKEQMPQTVTILGGPHINALPREALMQCGAADFVIFGEGEQTFAALLKHISKRAKPSAVPGIGYRDGQGIILNSPASAIENLDTIPFPARNKFPLNKYYDPDRYEDAYTLMVTSRGCPYNCIFCGSSATWGRKVRFRSATNVLDEIEQVIREFGISNITFCDDTFTLGRRRVLEICNGIIERGYNIKFLCSSRINTIDEDRLEALAGAGCTEISFGVESGDPEILKTICKNIELDQVKAAFEMVKSFGIRVHSSYIIGNPGDTDETIRKTIEFAIDSGTDAAQFSISTPYPGTPLWSMAIQQNKLKSRDYSEFKWYYSVVANLSKVSDDDLINYQRNAYSQFEESRKKMSHNKSLSCQLRH
ncbi:MAG: hypothetical protein CO189_03010 [candidate division Zixibacteria bacterium CG_4_9_14_3_um_filter_46_8]|nr:MAG: hypothetical protein CO189_03010 [candidate division Zixibacteria bacterium CG_4_9_14_3_um_filter_46_8]